MSRFAALCTTFHEMSPDARRAAALDGLRYLAEAYDHEGDALALEKWLQMLTIAIVRADLARDADGGLGIGAA